MDKTNSGNSHSDGMSNQDIDMQGHFTDLDERSDPLIVQNNEGSEQQVKRPRLGVSNDTNLASTLTLPSSSLLSSPGSTAQRFHVAHEADSSFTHAIASSLGPHLPQAKSIESTQRIEDCPAKFPSRNEVPFLCEGMTIADVREHLSQAIKRRGKLSLAESESINILRVYFMLVFEMLEARAASGCQKFANAANRSSQILGYGSSTVSKVIKQWSEASSRKQDFMNGIRVKPSAGNRLAKEARIPNTRVLNLKVRDYIMTACQHRERVTATGVLDHLVADGTVSIKRNPAGLFDKKDRWAALVATRRYLTRKGFCRSTKTGHLKFDPKELASRDEYVRRLQLNRNLPGEERLCEIYIDETCVSLRKGRSVIFGQDISDQQDVSVLGKEDCCQIRAALLYMEGQNSFLDHIEPLEKTSFEACCISANQNTKQWDDNQVSTNGSEFIRWFRHRLLPHLRTPCLIVMSRSEHHLQKPSTMPIPESMTWAKLSEELNKAGQQYEPSMSTVELQELLQQWQDKNVLPEVVSTAQAAGHSVLFTPPGYDDLNPFMTLWAQMKSRMTARAPPKTLQELKGSLEQEYEKLLCNGDQGHITQATQAMNSRIEKYLVDMNLEAGNSDDEEYNDSAEQFEMLLQSV